MTLPQLTDEDIEARLLVDPRRGDDLAEPWQPLVTLSRSHLVGASIALSPTNQSILWLQRLPHFTAFTADQRVPGVTEDFPQMSDLCLEALAGQGCRSVGMICALGGDADFFRQFHEKAAGLGLRVDPDWILPGDSRDLWPGQFQELGFKSFRKLWQQPTRPEGLMIYPDSFMPGVINAMLELNVKAPGDIRLAYHRNEQTPIFNPFSGTEAILKESDIAAALIAQARKLNKDKPCKQVKVRFHRHDKTL